MIARTGKRSSRVLVIPKSKGTDGASSETQFAFRGS